MGSTRYPQWHSYSAGAFIVYLLSRDFEIHKTALRKSIRAGSFRGYSKSSTLDLIRILKPHSSRKSIEMDSFIAIALFFNKFEAEAQISGDEVKGRSGSGSCFTNQSEVLTEMYESPGGGSGNCTIA
ncbi:hypothetical protein FIBSPDRAFT_860026 [Athelia psychrophila]|uniref:Uncharacterized protein n=1 Tax=Athelia psychrophila TaxID=1759441 RepID=A0A166KPP6_9AGAM|nr:hypothetical protein FIBSPDRAFT_860026 [Fibularhizoctonia sp. CBS 109695]